MKTEAPTLRRRLLVDALWCLGLALPVLASILIPAQSVGAYWDGLAVVFGFGCALALRHIVPIAALLAVVIEATWIAAEYQQAQPWSGLAVLALSVVSYRVGRADTGEHSLLVQFGATAVIMCVLIPLLGMRWQEWTYAYSILVFAVLVPWLIGRYRYQHAQLVTAGWTRAVQLEHEQRAVADQARLRERTRIAEDMHDSLGHELSLIAVRAGALEVDAELPKRHQDAAGQLRESAAVATERLREIIGILRDDNSPSLTPADDGIRDLIERATGSGMDISFQLRGDSIPLPRMADRAAYRVVQEALTNAAKHAPNSPVAIECVNAEGYTTVSVLTQLEDDPVEAVGNQRGLAGLTERVRLAGGSLWSGKRDGQFEVYAKLPHDAAADMSSAAREVSDSPSRARHVAERTRLRRRLIVALVFPVVLLSILTLGSFVVYQIGLTYSALSPQGYDKLQVGESLRDTEKVTPALEMFSPPTHVGVPDGVPADAQCSYYTSTKQSEHLDDVYQLCFANGKLASKAVIPPER